MKSLRIALSATFIVAATALAFFNVPAAIIAICAVVLVVLHPRFDSVIEFSFGPLTAKLERNLKESENLLASLKELAVLQTEMSVAVAARTGRFAQQDDWLFQRVRALESKLKAMGVSEAQLNEVRSDFIRYTLIDLGYRVLGNAQPFHFSEALQMEWKALRHGEDLKNPDALENFLKKCNLLDDDRRGLISDMRWIVEHGDVRDVEQHLRAKAEPKPLGQ